jgi:hypothetical protein
MSDIPIEINFTSGLIAIVVLIILNGMMAMAETALLSARKARLQNESNKGNSRAGIALKLTETSILSPFIIRSRIAFIDMRIGATPGVRVDLPLQQIPFLTLSDKYMKPYGRKT